MFGDIADGLVSVLDSNDVGDSFVILVNNLEERFKLSVNERITSTFQMRSSKNCSPRTATSISSRR